jgi:hypothetical protein
LSEQSEEENGKIRKEGKFRDRVEEMLGIKEKLKPEEQFKKETKLFNIEEELDKDEKELTKSLLKELEAENNRINEFLFGKVFENKEIKILKLFFKKNER